MIASPTEMLHGLAGVESSVVTRPSLSRTASANVPGTASSLSCNNNEILSSFNQLRESKTELHDLFSSRNTSQLAGVGASTASLSSLPATPVLDRSNSPKGIVSSLSPLKRKAGCRSTPATKRSKTTKIYSEVTSGSDTQDRKHQSEPDRLKPVLCTVDGVKKYSGSQRDTSAIGSPRKRPRGGGATRGRSGVNMNGSGKGKGKAKAQGKRDESPDPPHRKRILSSDDEEQVKKLKARQQELKRFFNIVGTQQIELLEQLATRDMSKLLRRAKAHKSVPEFEQIVGELEAVRDERCRLIHKAHAIQVEAEGQRVQREIELIEQQYLTHCQEVQEEHRQGVDGDMALLRHARAADKDETRTENGSEVDYLPRYHEFPEADAHIRGYLSSRISDEKSFKQHLATGDDQARQEVIDEDLIQPMIDSINERKREEQQEFERKQSQTLAALSDEASKQLNHMMCSKESQSQPAPRSTQERDNDSYALSALADVSDYLSQQQRQKQFVRMPLASGERPSRNSFSSTTSLPPAPASAMPPGPASGHRPLAPAPSAPPVLSPLNSAPASNLSQAFIPAHSRNRTLSYSYGRNNSIQHINTNSYSSIPSSMPPTTAPTPTAQIPVISQGPGQLIAPAPPRSNHTPRLSLGNQAEQPTASMFAPTNFQQPYPAHQLSMHQPQFQTYHSSYPSMPMDRLNGRTPSHRQQQYNFLPPQQPIGHRSAPLAPISFPSSSNTMSATIAARSSHMRSSHPASPTYGPAASSYGMTGGVFGGLGGSLLSVAPGTPSLGLLDNLHKSSTMSQNSGQSKIPVTFVNQTIRSRQAAQAVQEAAQRAHDETKNGMMSNERRRSGSLEKKDKGDSEQPGNGSASKNGPRMLLPRV